MTLPVEGKPASEGSEFPAAVRQVHAESVLDLLSHVALATNQAESSERAIRAVLRCVCDHMGWEFGHVFLRRPPSGELVSTGLWHPQRDESSAALREATAGLALRTGIGVGGRVVETGRIVSAEISDLVPERFEAARRCGLHMVYGFPIMHGPQTVGVVEFFSRNPIPLDAATLQRLAFLGPILGSRLGRQDERTDDGNTEWRALVDEARATARRTEFLSDASALLASSLDYETTLRTIARMAVPKIADWCAVDVVGPDGSLRRLAVEHPDPNKVSLVTMLHERYPPPPDADYGVVRVIRTGEPELVPEIPDSLLEMAARDAEHLRILRELGLRSYVIAPLALRNRVLGAIVLAYAESERRYDAADLSLLTELARRAATAIENAELVRDLHAARDLLERQAEELAAQAEELQQTMEEMETAAEDLQEANETLALRTAEAEEARATAERANRVKLDFLSAMSHDLRTPLNAIAGYAQLLEMGIEGQLSPNQQTAIERIQINQRRLLALVTDILQFAKVEAGQLQFARERVAVNDILAGLNALVEPQVRARSQSLECGPCDPDLIVMADAERVEQILLNLLSNAIKFTDPGGAISVTCSATRDRVEIHVRDNGPGIAPDHMEAIFEPFMQVRPHSIGERDGVGLGLAISRQLARGMGGDLTGESVVGEGSVFVCSLPRAS